MTRIFNSYCLWYKMYYLDLLQDFKEYQNYIAWTWTNIFQSCNIEIVFLLLDSILHCVKIVNVQTPISRRLVTEETLLCLLTEVTRCLEYGLTESSRLSSLRKERQKLSVHINIQV